MRAEIRLVPQVQVRARVEMRVQMVMRLGVLCPVCHGPSQPNELAEHQVGYKWCACCGAPVANHADPEYQELWDLYEEARGEGGVALLTEEQYIELSAAERLEYVQGAIRDAAFMVQNAPTGTARRVAAMLRPFIDRLKRCRAQLLVERDR